MCLIAVTGSILSHASAFRLRSDRVSGRSKGGSSWTAGFGFGFGFGFDFTFSSRFTSGSDFTFRRFFGFGALKPTGSSASTRYTNSFG